MSSDTSPTTSKPGLSVAEYEKQIGRILEDLNQKSPDALHQLLYDLPPEDRAELLMIYPELRRWYRARNLKRIATELAIGFERIRKQAAEQTAKPAAPAAQR
jgi:hypothetical protein